MRLVDRHVERAFRTTADGTLAFYPLGPCLRGYAVINAAQKTTLQTVMRTFVIQHLLVLAISLGAAFGLMLIRFHVGTSQGTAATAYKLLGVSWNVVLFGPTTAVYVIWHRKFRGSASGLKVLPPELGWIEALRQEVRWLRKR
jgi:hypothetical protein